MSLLEQMNGTILRGLAVFGALAIAVLVLMVLNWLAVHVFGYEHDAVLDAMVSISVLMFAGAGGVKYASGKKITNRGDSDE